MYETTTHGDTGAMDEMTETEALLGLACEIVERQTGGTDAALVRDVFRQLCDEVGADRADGRAVH